MTQQWGQSLDSRLIDYWRNHEALFNSSLDTYHNKELKTRLWTEFALSIGRTVSDVERRSRSLRTQYGRVLCHPERVTTVQQKMLKEKLDFLRPYIVPRRIESCVEENSVERDGDEEDVETEGSLDQEVASCSGSPLNVLEVGQDPQEQLPSLKPQPHLTQKSSLSCHQHHIEESHEPMESFTTANHNILHQFVQVMLSDMQQIKDPLVLMKLRRDITDLVFKAAEEDAGRRRLRVEAEANRRSVLQLPQADCCGRQRFPKRKYKETENERWERTWEETRLVRRGSSGQPAGSENGSEDSGHGQEIRRDGEIKIEYEF